LVLRSFISSIPNPPTSPLFPYTTLFRSRAHGDAVRVGVGATHLGRGNREGVIAEIGRGLREQRLDVASRQGRVGEVPRPGALERSEEHTSELQSRVDLVCRLLLEKKNTI